MLIFMLACAGKDSDSAEILVQTELSGYVTQLLGGDGMEGVSVCANTCVTTDEEGFYNLISEESSAERLLIMTGDELVSGMVPVLARPPSQDVPNVSLVSPALIEAQMAMVDLEWEEGHGILVFSFSNGIFGDGVNVSEAVLGMEEAVGDGPFYTSTQGLPATDLIKTSRHGGGVWLNLPPGNHRFVPANLPSGCTLLLGWGSVETIVLPIQADHITFMRVECIDS